MLERQLEAARSKRVEIRKPVEFPNCQALQLICEREGWREGRYYHAPGEIYSFVFTFNDFMLGHSMRTLPKLSGTYDPFPVNRFANDVGREVEKYIERCLFEKLGPCYQMAPNIRTNA